MSFKVSFKEDDINGELHQQEEDKEEGQWRNLTNDVLALILKRLNTKADLCRFRSICKSWRLFASPPQNHILFPLFLPPINPNSRKFALSPTLIYIISPKFEQLQQQRVWLAKVAEIGGKRWDLLNPLTKSKLYFPSGVFKNRINLLGFRNLEVGRSYRLQLIDNFSEEDSTFGFEDFSSSIFVKKIVVNVVEDRVSVLGLNNYGNIALWNLGDENWKIIEDENHQFEDVICYDGRFFAVDKRGRLVAINPTTMEMNEVITAMEDWNGMSMYSYLVEANFKLHMVNKIVDPRPVNYYDDEEEEWVVDKAIAGKPLGFNVYALNQKRKSWEKVESLGNTVLFVSRDATFSVSAEDLGWRHGNCIYFEGLTGYDDEADMRFGLNAGVYSLEFGGAFTTLDSAPDWTQIFWPHPSWFSSTSDYAEIEMQD